MHVILYAFLFCWTVLVAYRYGIGPVFGLCFLPAVLLVNFAKSVNMPLLPNITSLTVVMYAVLAVLPFKWRDLPPLRWNVLDTLMLILPIPLFVTTFLESGDLKLSQRNCIEFACTWFFPYLLARVAIQQPDARKWTLRALCVLSIFMGLLTAVESSGFRPNMTARVLGKLQWNTTSNAAPQSMVFMRFGLARAIVTAGQQIDLGNVGVLVGTMVLIMVPATGAKWTSPLVVGGILGAGAMVMGSVSMTSWAAMIVAFVGYAAFTRPRYGRYLIVPLLLAELTFMAAQSHSMLAEPPVGDRPGTDVGDSRWIRTKIMQDAWPIASTSGWFGYGIDVDVSKVGVGSVDNAYLLFIMETGWFSLMLWLTLMVAIVLKGSAAMGRATTASERLPLGAIIAGLLAIVFAMYTVFFGFVYAILFACVVGMLSSMCQMLARPQAATAAAYAGGGMPRGFPAMAGGGR